MSDPIRELYERLEELERRVNQMVVRGKIKEVNPSKAIARVEYGDNLVTGWITWKPIRTGKATVWWCPEIGEGVTVISSGNVSQGEIFPGSYHDQFPAPSNNPDVLHVDFGDGSLVSHDRGSGEFNLLMQGTINISSHKNLNINVKGNAGIICDGDMEAIAKGNITAKGTQIILNDGTPMQGVVRQCDICSLTGKPHPVASKIVFAGG